MYKKNKTNACRVALISLTLLAPAAHAIGTDAGANITNTATATFNDPLGAPTTVNSNPSVIQVDEIMDVTLVSNDAGNVLSATPSSNRALSFTLTNIGNGTEAFALSTVSNVSGDQFDPTNTRIYLDNGDGVFDILTDTLYVSGSNDPIVAEDATRVIFVVSDIPASLFTNDIGQASLIAEAITAQITAGTDPAGTAFAGQGTGGSDAVVGSTLATANATNGYVISQVTTSLNKAQVVLDPFGGNNAIPGATITYTLTFNVTGTGNLTNTQIVDAIPVGTTYVPGTITLDAAPLTDITDVDAGRFNTPNVEVGLGVVAAPATHTVVFQVTID